MARKRNKRPDARAKAKREKQTSKSSKDGKYRKERKVNSVISRLLSENYDDQHLRVEVTLTKFMNYFF